MLWNSHSLSSCASLLDWQGWHPLIVAILPSTRTESSKTSQRGSTAAHPPFFSWMSSWMSFSFDTVTGMKPPGNSGRRGRGTASTSLHE